MATKTISWGTGSGSITLTSTGQGNGTITVTSDPNNLTVARSKTITIKTTDNAVRKTVTIVQAAMSANFLLSDGNFLLLSDGNYFNVQENT